MLTHAGIVRAACPAGQCDFARLLAPTSALVSSVDLAICHLEVPVAPPGTPWTGYPTFGAPAAVAAGLAATGWDRCSTASNHSLDKGRAGIDATLDALDAAGVGHAGTARTADEARPVVFEVKGVRVAHLSYAYGFNGFRRPSGEPWRANVLSVPAIEADARAARAAGAEVVIVSLHWGLEYHSAPTPEQRRIAEQLTSSGLIDLIVGHHAHVLQPIEQVNGHWVVYGLGNHLSAQRFAKRPASTEDGAIVTVRFTERAGGSFTVEHPVAHPTWVHPVTRQVLLVDDALSAPQLSDATKTLLRASRQRTASVLRGSVAVKPA